MFNTFRAFLFFLFMTSYRFLYNLKAPVLILSLFLYNCSGSKKYFKAAEKLEKQGLINEAAEFYYESLSRNNSNTNARIKLKEIGQKYVDFLSSQFFREFNTNQYEASINTYEKMQSFKDKALGLNVELNFPAEYKDDYQTAIDNYIEDNYSKGVSIFKQKKYKEALPYFEKVKKYKPEYKKLQTYYTIANCEPLYQSILIGLQNKSYYQVLQNIQKIYQYTDIYKDVKDIEELVQYKLTKNILVFKTDNNTARSVNFNNIDAGLTAELLNKIFTAQHPEYLKVNDDNLFGKVNYDAIKNQPDLLRGIAKATGSDYFLYTIASNKQIYAPNPQIKQFICYQGIIKKVGESIVTEYFEVPYNNVKIQKSFGFDLVYQIIDAQNLQAIINQSIPIKVNQNKEYNEFISKPTADIKNYYPYNPVTTPIFSQYNPKAWRDLFFVSKDMKSNDELKQEALQQAVSQIQQSFSTLIR